MCVLRLAARAPLLTHSSLQPHPSFEKTRVHSVGGPHHLSRPGEGGGTCSLVAGLSLAVPNGERLFLFNKIPKRVRQHIIILHTNRRVGSDEPSTRRAKKNLLSYYTMLLCTEVPKTETRPEISTRFSCSQYEAEF